MKATRMQEGNIRSKRPVSCKNANHIWPAFAKVIIDLAQAGQV